MRESMARLTPRFSANRAVCEYTEQRYLPAASAYHSRAADKGASGRRMVEWRHSLDQKWAGLRFGELKIETRGDQHTVNVQVYLGDLNPEAVRIEIFADGASDVGPVRQEMTPGQPLAGAAGGYGYSGSVSAVRRHRTMRPERCHSAKALRFPWRPGTSCGNVEGVISMDNSGISIDEEP